MDDITPLDRSPYWLLAWLASQFSPDYCFPRGSVSSVIQWFFGDFRFFFKFSFEMVLISDQQATKDSFSTVWTLELIKGLVLSFLLVASAISVAAFFSEPEVEVIFY